MYDGLEDDDLFINHISEDEYNAICSRLQNEVDCGHIASFQVFHNGSMEIDIDIVPKAAPEFIELNFTLDSSIPEDFK